MKKIVLILVSLLMPTLKSFCQTATANDSLVIISKQIVLRMIADIQSGDEAKEEKELLQEQLVLQAEYVDQADSVTEYYKRKVVALNNLLQDRSELSDTYKLQLDKVARKSETQRKWINYLLIGLGTSLIINFSH